MVVTTALSDDLKTLENNSEMTIKNLEAFIQTCVDNIIKKTEHQYKRLSMAVKKIDTKVDIATKSFDIMKVTKEIDAMD